MKSKEKLTKDALDDVLLDDFSEYDAIADYYKEIEYVDNSLPADVPKRTIISDPDMYANEGYTPVIKKRRYKGNIISDVAFVSVSLLAAMLILLICFKVGSIGVKEAFLVEDKYLELLESSSKYNDLIHQISSLGTEIEDLARERDLIQKENDALIAYREGEGAIEEQIAALQSQLASLNEENKKKQAEIDALAKDISEKISTVMNLSPGIYTVGERISAGSYNVTGSGSILVSSAQGSVKLNTVLSAEATALILEDGDKIQLDTRAKFAPSGAEEDFDE